MKMKNIFAFKTNKQRYIVYGIYIFHVKSYLHSCQDTIKAERIW